MPFRYHEDVINWVYDRLDADNTLLPYKKEDKKYPNTSDPYIEVLIRPDDTVKPTIGADLMTGFLLFNTYFKKGDGVLDPSTEAKKVLQLFPRDLEFPVNAQQGGIRITRRGTTYGPQDGVDDREGWRYTPTTIPYEVMSCPV